jgi:epoxyqueuosine reductase
MTSPNPTHPLKDRLRAAAQAEGFALFGVAHARPLEDDLGRLGAWLASGRAGPLASWMADRPERRARPELLLPGARSVVMLGMAYGQEPADPSRLSELPEGRVSRHAQGMDYHRVIGPRVRRLAEWLDAEVRRLGMSAEEGGGSERTGEAPVSSLAFVDTGPLLERAFAVRGGLGFIGRNNCLIHPRHGSWFFLAAIVTRAALPPDAPLEHAGCGECRRCLDACPTGALCAPYELDARRCLACLTVETRDAFEPAVAARLGNRLFGCDTCQEVCPYNAEALPCSEPALKPQERSVAQPPSAVDPTDAPSSSVPRSEFPSVAATLDGAIATLDSVTATFDAATATLDCATTTLDDGAPSTLNGATSTLDGATATLEALLQIRSNSEFERLLGPSGMARARRRGLQRNAAAVAANLGRTDLKPKLS